MHAYSIDKNIRTKYAIFIFVISIGISMLLRHFLASPVDDALANTFWGDIVGFFSSTGVFPNCLEAAVIYSLLSFLYEKWIWRWPLIRKLHGIPNLNGIWKGELHSSYCDDSFDMSLKIKQTWSKIAFQATFAKSSSYSNVAAINIEDNRGITIYFGFRNDSKDIESHMQSYEGYNILVLTDEETISARYFNNRPNQNKKIKGGNVGTYTLHKVGKTKSGGSRV